MIKRSVGTLVSFPWKYLIVFLVFSVTVISPASGLDQGWGGHFEGGTREYEKYLTLMHADGWTCLRVYGWIPWLHGGQVDYSLEELDYIVGRAAELSITVYLDLEHNYPPSDYLEGHVDELIAYETLIGLRYNDRTNVVIEVVNEWQPESTQEGYDTFQCIITALREAGVRLPLLINYHAAWLLDFSHELDDPLDRLIYGNHYYGNTWDMLGDDLERPMNLTTFSNEIGVTRFLDDLFLRGDIAETLVAGNKFAVTELGCSYDYSDQWVKGGYDMSPGGVAFLLMFMKYAEEYGVTVIGHRIGDSYQCDYQAYKQLAMEYFGVELDPVPVVVVSAQTNNPVLFIIFSVGLILLLLKLFDLI